MENNITLEIKNLQISNYSTGIKINLINDLNLNVFPGKVTALIGESGSGKSLTALAIMGLLPSNIRVEFGSIKLNGVELTDISTDEHRKMRGRVVSMIFQEPMTSLNPVITVGEQIAEMFRLHCNCSNKEAFERAVEMLRSVGIAEPSRRAKQYPHQLSGGMRQRVMIGIAMAAEPLLLIADEPTTALDVTVESQILELMKNLISQKKERSMLFITHNIGIVSEIAENVVVMYAGSEMESGRTKKIIESPSHPYTAGLISSMLTMKTNKERLPVIQGYVPRPGEIQSGCAFRQRCSFASDKCSREIPVREKIYLGSLHRSRCILEN